MIGRSNAPRDSEYILLIVLDIILDEPARTAVAKVVHEFDTRPADHDGQPRRLIVVMSRHRAASIFAIHDAVTPPARQAIPQHWKRMAKTTHDIRAHRFHMRGRQKPKCVTPHDGQNANARV